MSRTVRPHYAQRELWRSQATSALRLDSPGYINGRSVGEWVAQPPPPHLRSSEKFKVINPRFLNRRPTAATMSTIGSPISRLPQEILLEIFHVGSCLTGSPFDAMDFSILVSLVCYQWRTLALSSSRLWSTILLEFGQDDSWPAEILHESAKSRFRHVPQFLERSRQAPLRVFLSIRAFEDESGQYQHENVDLCTKGFNFLLEAVGILLAPHGARFREFHLLSGSITPIIEILAHLPPSAMTLLETLEIHCSVPHQSYIGDFEPQGIDHTLSTFLNPSGSGGREAVAYFANAYPRLKDVTLCGIPLPWSSFAPRNLTSLTLNFLPIDVRPRAEDLCALLLGNAHSLETLSIQGSAPCEEGKPFTLPKLVTLSLGYAYPEEVSYLIPNIRVPNLKNLIVTDLRRCLSTSEEEVVASADPYSTILLFAALCRHFPLRTLEELTLCYVLFAPPSPTFALRRPPPDLATTSWPHSFFSHLISLKSLKVHDPDEGILKSLNSLYYKPQVSKEMQRVYVTFPRLQSLQLHCRASDRDLVRRFLNDRIMYIQLARRYNVPRLKDITVSAAAKWAHQFDTRGLVLIADQVTGIENHCSAKAYTSVGC